MFVKENGKRQSMAANVDGMENREHSSITNLWHISYPRVGIDRVIGELSQGNKNGSPDRS